MARLAREQELALIRAGVQGLIRQHRLDKIGGQGSPVMQIRQLGMYISSK